MVVLYWLTNPGKPWKTFVSNRIKKIAEITNELGITWKYCPSNKNLADLGSRGANMEKLQNGSWFNGPDWLLEKEQWPEQPNLKVKKTLYKTLGRSHLSFENLEMVLMDIEINMNNRPLTYVESESGEEEVLTPNVIIRGRNTYLLDDIENDVDELTKMQKRIAKAKNNAWKRWQREYVHSLMESQRVNGKPVNAPEVGEVVLVVGEEKNRSEWKKGRVVRQVKGKDGVVHGVVLLHKGHTIERPLQLVCPLVIRCTTQIEQRKNEEKQTVENERKKRGAAIEASKKIRELAENEDAD
jgi:hypothetical protein